MLSNYRERIALEPGKRGGRPLVRGTRIAVADVLGWLASGMTYDEMLDDYPEIGQPDILACLAFAAERENRLLPAGE